VALWLSKIATALLLPLSVVALLLVASIACALLRRARAAAALAFAALALLWTLSAPIPSAALRRPIEGRFPARPIAELPEADAIVVLGGAIEGIAPPRLRPEVNPAGDRPLYAAALYRAGKAPVVIASGGAYAWQSQPPDSHGVRDLLVEIGVPVEAIRVEDTSQTTWENCVASRALLGGGRPRILLVTSALHMPRALGACRAAGLDAIPAATDVEALDDPGSGLLHWLPDAQTLEASDRAVKELAGLIVYGLRGQLADEPREVP
jgi:uncharacterized SAM-binding protein YcdF (DUF218 family)